MHQGAAALQRQIVGVDGFGELLDEHADLADLGAQRLGRSLCPLDCIGHLAFHRGDAAAEFGHLASEVGHLAGEVGNAAREVADRARWRAAAPTPRHDAAQRKAGQRRDRAHHRFGDREARAEKEHGAERGRDQHH